MRALTAIVSAALALTLASCSGQQYRSRSSVAGDLVAGGDRQKMTDALAAAAASGWIDLMERALDAGADPSGRSKDGYVPLSYAIANNHADAAKLLLARGAATAWLRQPAPDFNNISPIEFADRAGHSRMAGLLRDAAPAGEPAATAPTAYASLHAAIYARDLDGVKRLVESGADINKRTSLGPLSSPLPQAVLKGTPEIVAYLVSKGAGQQLDALEYAAAMRRPEMIDTLLAAGVNPSPDMNARRTPGYALIEDAVRRRAARSAPGNLDNDAYARLRSAASLPPEKKEPASDVDSPARRGPERPDDFALVIGIDEYQSLPKAEYGARDAKIVRKHYEAMGVPARNIISLEGSQATGSKLRNYLQQWLPRNVKPTSTVFVYYSGHGAPDPSSGDAYLVPWDADAMFLTTSGYPLKQFYAELAALKAKRVLVALDACFSGSGGRSVLAKGARPLVAKVDESVPSSANLTVLAAASGSEITGSLEEQGHGIFTYYYLKGLTSGAKTPRALFDFLKPQVQDDARRQNREQSPTLSGGGTDAPF